MYDRNMDGLSLKWEGRVWLKPPYSRPLIEQFVRKLAEHGNGIALLFNPVSYTHLDVYKRQAKRLLYDSQLLFVKSVSIVSLIFISFDKFVFC